MKGKMENSMHSGKSRSAFAHGAGKARPNVTAKSKAVHGSSGGDFSQKKAWAGPKQK